MASRSEPRMVAQGGGIGRALTGWIRSAGKSSVREIANLSHFLRHGRQFRGWNGACLRFGPCEAKPFGRLVSDKVADTCNTLLT